MKRLWSYTVVALVIIGTMLDLICGFYENDTLHYFASEPICLFYVAGIAIAGGLMVLAFSRFSRQTQQRVCLLGWGAAASFCTAFCGWLVYQSISLSPIIITSGGGNWLPLVPVLSALIAAHLWFEFYQVWKTKSKGSQ